MESEQISKEVYLKQLLALAEFQNFMCEKRQQVVRLNENGDLSEKVHGNEIYKFHGN